MIEEIAKYRVGIDVGSTTVKVVVLDNNDNIIYKEYTRHLSKIREVVLEILNKARGLLGGESIKVAITGSAGLGLSNKSGVPFVQEVIAAKTACETLLEDIDVVIELGGEDAKILFLSGASEERMNGSCAGGTGSFIDQMASLMNVSIEELDRLSLNYNKTYSIASRCGVFAKSDIQPLLNQGASKEDLSASIYAAIVNQTIAGLAQGREIKGRVAFLGGPLTFQMGLREQFIKALNHETSIFPENAQYYIAIGAALYSGQGEEILFDETVQKLSEVESFNNPFDSLPPLFENDDEYIKFKNRHRISKANYNNINEYVGDAYLGIDAGSTTTKMVLITSSAEILFEYYMPNCGDPVSLVKNELINIRTLCGDRIKIKSSAVTGYGEDLIKSACGVDFGLVETIAHFTAAKHFNPNVDFILDIGGQDIKCFKIKNGTIDSILLNEACSSGCGSFIETFAKALGYTVEDFSKIALFSKSPVNLGSRCTVFMNSSVKQAQKDGASVGDISAGLAVSVIKNALYKVIRANSKNDIGENIVVQGGTFLNDAILRSFEFELGRDVTRSSIAGLMGAFGAALYARETVKSDEISSLISLENLLKFTHTSKAANCKLCTNNCRITINTFMENKKYISGNRCERPNGNDDGSKLPDAFRFKLDRLLSYKPKEGKLGKIGIPLGLNMYENLPLWHTLLTQIGFEVITTGVSTRALYVQGQHTIPSDTVCYPAKLLHGHIEELIDKGITRIFYPCMPYNFNEGMGDNHYNCPVVAYYPELLNANVPKLKDVSFLHPYFAPHKKTAFTMLACEYFNKEFGVSKTEVKKAVKKAYEEYYRYKADIINHGTESLKFAKDNGLEVIILAGRPYHIDPEINHGINSLVTSLGRVVLSDDSISSGVYRKRSVLNQWTYHSRMYNVADFATNHDNIQVVQLVSFGCGLDAVTSDEMRDTLEGADKLYTQVKIDEINNLGAAKIRLRSLIAATKSK